MPAANKVLPKPCWRTRPRVPLSFNQAYFYQPFTACIIYRTRIFPMFQLRKTQQHYTIALLSIKHFVFILLRYFFLFLFRSCLQMPAGEDTAGSIFRSDPDIIVRDAIHNPFFSFPCLLLLQCNLLYLAVIVFQIGFVRLCP